MNGDSCFVPILDQQCLLAVRKKFAQSRESAVVAMFLFL